MLARAASRAAMRPMASGLARWSPVLASQHRAMALGPAASATKISDELLDK